MTQKPDTNLPRILRAARQQLESLRRAGVTHIAWPKGRKLLSVGAAAKPTAPTAQNPAATASPPKQFLAPEPVIASPPVSLPVVRNEVAAMKVAPAHQQPTGKEVSREEALAAVALRVAACVRCKELADTRTQTVFGDGNPYAKLVFLGEAPGADEDRQGKPFVGRAGQLLTDIIVKGMKLRREDVYIMNILRCRPPENRQPLPVEAAACREYLDAQLAIIQPEFVCCLGATAAHNFLGVDTPIGRMRGRMIDFGGMHVLCTYHPAYVLRNPPAKKQVWDDIQVLMEAMGIA
jgi:DNA polymerase